jgi:hypothetical protein
MLALKRCVPVWSVKIFTCSLAKRSGRDEWIWAFCEGGLKIRWKWRLTLCFSLTGSVICSVWMFLSRRESPTPS